MTLAKSGSSLVTRAASNTIEEAAIMESAIPILVFLLISIVFSLISSVIEIGKNFLSNSLITPLSSSVSLGKDNSSISVIIE